MNGIDNEDACFDDAPVILQSPAVAYVRPVRTEIGTHYAVCSGDGTQLAVFDTQDAAWFAAKQQDLDPVLIH